MSVTMSKFGEPTSRQICLIYNPENGHVVHTHEVVTYPGGRQMKDSDVESQALALLSRRTELNVANLKVLHVQPAEYQKGTRYQIELDTQHLIAMA